MKSLGSAKNDKRISKFHLILDHKATNKTLKLWAFITQVIERTYLGDNHSKILLVQSERQRVSKIKLHSQEIMLAQVGSPLAIENAHRNLLDMEDDE